MENNLFIPYEQAEQLNQLGFYEDCLGWYNIGELVQVPTKLDYIRGTYKSYLAPSYSQAFKFFKEQFDFRYSVGATNICVYHIPVTNYHTTFLIQDCKSYEEVELECIKKFIEHAQQFNN